MATSPFTAPLHVLTRGVSARYADCLRADASSTIDLPLARAQHEAYVTALRALSLTVEVLSSDSTCPDACFIEDTAVVTGAHALATCPGAPSRRAEVSRVADALARRVVVQRMEAPAHLDGGDVLRIDSRLFVGLSTRTNRDGVLALARVARLDGLEVIEVAVRGGLHLKSACTLASSSLLLHDPTLMTEADLAPFRVAGVEHLAAPASEPAGANVLALGDAVLVSAAAPRTADALRGRGLDVRVIDVSEFHKGDGALTCLSLRIPRAGCWSS